MSHPHLAAARLGMVRIAPALLGSLGAFGAGCTTYRIVRWREPGPEAHAAIFSQRLVRRADSPFVFARGSPRTDLDTILVRDTDGSMRRFSAYAVRHRFRAFLVIRDDTIVYEQYFAGYTDSTRSSSFSVAKSVTSVLLGAALDRREVRSLEDTVTRYISRLADRPAMRDITIGDLLGMKSGLAYTRTNGSLWHDFRSGDASCFYTNDRRALLAEQRREKPPGTEWAYKDCDTELLGWVLTEATQRSIAAQLEERVWRRIGTEFDASWNLDHGGSDGLENTAAGFNAAARDYARLARLYLRHGEWNGRQIISQDWVAASTTLSPRPEPEVPVWWEMQHQHLWWIPMQNWAAEQDFFADGAKGSESTSIRERRRSSCSLPTTTRRSFRFDESSIISRGSRMSTPVAFRASSTARPWAVARPIPCRHCTVG
jgi:CubicO group peptidase (beta-lactamase class C family)